jgi:hypothetical protein
MLTEEIYQFAWSLSSIKFGAVEKSSLRESENLSHFRSVGRLVPVGVPDPDLLPLSIP